LRFVVSCQLSVGVSFGRNWFLSATHLQLTTDN
jgi:hypothetical protein